MARKRSASPTTMIVLRKVKRMISADLKSEDTEEAMDTETKYTTLTSAETGKKIQGIMNAVGKKIAKNQKTIDACGKVRLEAAESYDSAVVRKESAERERDEAIEEMKQAKSTRDGREKRKMTLEEENKKLWDDAAAEINSLLEKPPAF